MIIGEIAFTLKDGREAVLRSPLVSDAEAMLDFIKKASGETEFLMNYPEEYDGYSLEMEEAFIRGSNDSENGEMLACFVEGEFAGNCQISFRTGLKARHRASVAIAILKQDWGLGIGTRMFTELFRIAEQRGGIRQIELEFIEGNSRARHLYEKMGFRITGVKPDAIRLRDGRFMNEYMMVKRLDQEG